MKSEGWGKRGETEAARIRESAVACLGRGVNEQLQRYATSTRFSQNAKKAEVLYTNWKEKMRIGLVGLLRVEDET